jgi:hypothetical protein
MRFTLPSTHAPRFPLWLALLSLGAVACAQILGLNDPLPTGADSGSDAGDAGDMCTHAAVDDPEALFVAPGRDDAPSRGTSTSPLGTLAAALKRSGETIYVCGATTVDTAYKETLNVTRPVTIQGGFDCTGWTRCGTRAFLRAPEAGSAPTVTINANNVTLEGFDVEGPPGSAAVDVGSASGQGTVVRASRISGAQNSPNRTTRGVTVSGSVTVEDSDIRGGNGTAQPLTGSAQPEHGSVGVLVLSGEATIRRSEVHSGSGSCDSADAGAMQACFLAEAVEVRGGTLSLLKKSIAVLDPIKAHDASNLGALYTYIAGVHGQGTLVATDAWFLGTDTEASTNLGVHGIRTSGETTLDRVRIALGTTSTTSGTSSCFAVLAEARTLTLTNSAVVAGCPARGNDTSQRLGGGVQIFPGVNGTIVRNTLIAWNSVYPMLSIFPHASATTTVLGNLVLSNTVGLRLEACSPLLTGGFSNNALLAPTPLINACDGGFGDPAMIPGFGDNLIFDGGHESVVGFPLTSAATQFNDGWKPSASKPNGCRIARGFPLDAGVELDHDMDGVMRDPTRPSIGAWEVPRSECDGGP